MAIKTSKLRRDSLTWRKCRAVAIIASLVALCSRLAYMGSRLLGPILPSRVSVVMTTLLPIKTGTRGSSRLETRFCLKRSIWRPMCPGMICAGMKCSIKSTTANQAVPSRQCRKTTSSWRRSTKSLPIETLGTRVAICLTRGRLAETTNSMPKLWRGSTLPIQIQILTMTTQSSSLAVSRVAMNNKSTQQRSLETLIEGIITACTASTSLISLNLTANIQMSHRWCHSRVAAEW